MPPSQRPIRRVTTSPPRDGSPDRRSPPPTQGSPGTSGTPSPVPATRATPPMLLPPHSVTPPLLGGQGSGAFNASFDRVPVGDNSGFDRSPPQLLPHQHHNQQQQQQQQQTDDLMTTENASASDYPASDTPAYGLSRQGSGFLSRGRTHFAEYDVGMTTTTTTAAAASPNATSSPSRQGAAAGRFVPLLSGSVSADLQQQASPMSAGRAALHEETSWPSSSPPNAVQGSTSPNAPAVGAVVGVSATSSPTFLLRSPPPPPMNRDKAAGLLAGSPLAGSSSARHAAALSLSSSRVSGEDSGEYSVESFSPQQSPRGRSLTKRLRYRQLQLALDDTLVSLQQQNLINNNNHNSSSGNFFPATRMVPSLYTTPLRHSAANATAVAADRDVRVIEHRPLALMTQFGRDGPACKLRSWVSGVALYPAAVLCVLAGIALVVLVAAAGGLTASTWRTTAAHTLTDVAGALVERQGAHLRALGTSLVGELWLNPLVAAANNASLQLATNATVLASAVRIAATALAMSSSDLLPLDGTGGAPWYLSGTTRYAANGSTWLAPQCASMAVTPAAGAPAGPPWSPVVALQSTAAPCTACSRRVFSKQFTVSVNMTVATAGGGSSDGVVLSLSFCIPDIAGLFVAADLRPSSLTHLASSSSGGGGGTTGAEWVGAAIEVLSVGQSPMLVVFENSGTPPHASSVSGGSTVHLSSSAVDDQGQCVQVARADGLVNSTLCRDSILQLLTSVSATNTAPLSAVPLASGISVLVGSSAWSSISSSGFSGTDDGGASTALSITQNGVQMPMIHQTFFLFSAPEVESSLRTCGAVPSVAKYGVPLWIVLPVVAVLLCASLRHYLLRWHHHTVDVALVWSAHVAVLCGLVHQRATAASRLQSSVLLTTDEAGFGGEGYCTASAAPLVEQAMDAEVRTYLSQSKLAEFTEYLEVAQALLAKLDYYHSFLPKVGPPPALPNSLSNMAPGMVSTASAAAGFSAASSPAGGGGVGGGTHKLPLLPQLQLDVAANNPSYGQNRLELSGSGEFGPLLDGPSGSPEKVMHHGAVGGLRSSSPKNSFRRDRGGDTAVAGAATATASTGGGGGVVSFRVGEEVRFSRTAVESSSTNNGETAAMRAAAAFGTPPQLPLIVATHDPNFLPDAGVFPEMPMHMTSLGGAAGAMASSPGYPHSPHYHPYSPYHGQPKLSLTTAGGGLFFTPRAPVGAVPTLPSSQSGSPTQHLHSRLHGGGGGGGGGVGVLSTAASPSAADLLAPPGQRSSDNSMMPSPTHMHSAAASLSFLPNTLDSNAAMAAALGATAAVAGEGGGGGGGNATQFVSIPRTPMQSLAIAQVQALSLAVGSTAFMQQMSAPLTARGSSISGALRLPQPPPESVNASPNVNVALRPQSLKHFHTHQTPRPSYSVAVDDTQATLKRATVLTCAARFAPVGASMHDPPRTSRPASPTPQQQLGNLSARHRSGGGGGIAADSAQFLRIVIESSEQCDGSVTEMGAHSITVCWNAVSPYPFHEARAVQCAMHMAAQLDEHMPECSFHIAVATSTVLVERIGTSRTVRRTVNGFAVHLSQLLVRLGRQLSCSILVLETTYATARTRVTCIPIDAITYDGQVLLLYEALGPKEEEHLRQIDVAHRGFAALCSGRFSEARQCYEGLLSAGTGSGAATGGGSTQQVDAQLSRLARLSRALEQHQQSCLTADAGGGGGALPYMRNGPSWLIHEVAAEDVPLPHDVLDAIAAANDDSSWAAAADATRDDGASPHSGLGDGGGGGGGFRGGGGGSARSSQAPSPHPSPLSPSLPVPGAAGRSSSHHGLLMPHMATSSTSPSVHERRRSSSVNPIFELRAELERQLLEKAVRASAQSLQRSLNSNANLTRGSGGGGQNDTTVMTASMSMMSQGGADGTPLSRTPSCRSIDSDSSVVRNRSPSTTTHALLRRGDSVATAVLAVESPDDKQQQGLLEIVDRKGQTWRCSQKVLGQGTFGEVYVGLQTDGSLCAIKKVSLPLESVLGTAAAAAAGAAMNKSLCRGWSDGEIAENRSLQPDGGAAGGVGCGNGGEERLRNLTPTQHLASSAFAADNLSRRNSSGVGQSVAATSSYRSLTSHNNNNNNQDGRPTVTTSAEAADSQRDVAAFEASFLASTADPGVAPPPCTPMHEGLASPRPPPTSVISKEVDELLQEVATLSSVRSEYVVQYYGSAAFDGSVYIMMEFVGGGSLTNLLWSFGPLPLPSVRRFTMNILRGLKSLHAMGIVHRDVSPNNVLVAIDGTCKLSDFGCSQSLHRINRSTVAGTPQYMAPEACRGAATTASDIWSLGVLVHVLLTGRLPFPDDVLSLDGSEFVHRLAVESPPVAPADSSATQCSLLAPPPGPQTLFPSAAPLSGNPSSSGFSSPSNSRNADPSRSPPSSSIHSIGPMIAPELPPDAAEFIQLCLQRQHTKRPSAEQLTLHPFVLK